MCGVHGALSCSRITGNPMFGTLIEIRPLLLQRRLGYFCFLPVFMHGVDPFGTLWFDTWATE
jgi:hypothetical protein